MIPISDAQELDADDIVGFHRHERAGGVEVTMKTGQAAIVRCNTDAAAEQIMYLLEKVITMHQRSPLPMPSLSVFEKSGACAGASSEKQVRAWEYQRCYRHRWVGELLETDTMQRKWRRCGWVSWVVSCVGVMPRVPLALFGQSTSVLVSQPAHVWPICVCPLPFCHLPHQRGP